MIESHYGLYAGGLSALLFLVMLAGVEFGARRAALNPGKESTGGKSAIEAAVLGLLGLLIALSFSGAVDRINKRAVQHIDEASALGTAFQRFDAIPEPERTTARRLLRDYAASRVAEVSHAAEPSALELDRARTDGIREKLWSTAVAGAGRSKYPQAASLTLGPLNDCFDVALRRDAMRRIHPPEAVFALLSLICFFAAVLAGSGLADAASRRWLHRLVFCAAVSLTIFVALNLEHPRHGIVGMGESDLVLNEALADIERQLARP